jgi:hypothetical protein
MALFRHYEAIQQESINRLNINQENANCKLLFHKDTLRRFQMIITSGQVAQRIYTVQPKEIK